MQINWEDLSCPDVPGDYRFLDGIVTVTVKEIEIWEEHPEATFQLIPFQATTGPKRYLLGTADWED